MFRAFRGLLAGLVGAGLFGGVALADAPGFVGTWVNPKAGEGGFLGNLVGSRAGDNDIVRVVVTAAGVNAVRIHLYGRCDPACDWDSQLAHGHSGSPDSADVQSITADFNTGKAVKHLTLRKGPGGTLRFEVVTDFAGHSDQHDYEASGSLQAVAPAIAAAVPATPAAPPASGAAPVVPAPSAQMANAADFAEDCEKINPEDVYVAPSDRGWKVNDFDHTILNFGADKVGAVRASRVLEYYRFDEQCYIKRPKPKMIYWRTAGQIPREPMKGQDCEEVHVAAVEAKGGKVVDGSKELIDFGGDAASANQAASVIRTMKLNRQCFVARPSTVMVYWLAQ